MPSAIEYVPPTDRARNDFNSDLENETKSRIENYKTALAYYGGEQDYPLPSDETTQSDDATVINMVKMTADRTAQFLFSALPTFELDPTTPDDTDEEAWIKDFLDYNGGLTSLSKLALRGFLSGHCFVQVKPVAKEDKTDETITHYPRLLILDPTSVSVYWSADDVGKVLWYEKRYYVGKEIFIQDFIRAGNEWVIQTYKAPFNATSTWFETPTLHGKMWQLDFTTMLFEPVGEPAIHSSPLPPIVEWPHLPHPDDRYGLGEFTEKDLQDTINRIASARNRIVRENSDPTDIMTGADIEEIKDDGPIIAIPNPNAKIQRLEMKGDLTAISTVLKEMIEVYLAIARVVLLKGEAKDLQRVTNNGVRTMFLDMLAKNNLLQYAYGQGLITVVRLALFMGYGDGTVKLDPKNLKPKLKWASPLPTDMSELANIAAIYASIGSQSKRTTATDAGKDWPFEQAAMKAEHEESMKQQEEQLALETKFAPSPTETGMKPKSNLTQSKKPVE